MNIFILSNCPVEAAQVQADVHVVKMVLETGQILSTVQRRYGNKSEKLYKSTHANHPCVLWAGFSESNYRWLFAHFEALANEYNYRYGKTHATWSLNYLLHEAPASMPKANITPFAQAMPDQYRRADAVEAYRGYYRSEKASIAKWTRRSVPEWMRVDLTASKDEL